MNKQTKQTHWEVKRKSDLDREMNRHTERNTGTPKDRLTEWQNTQIQTARVMDDIPTDWEINRQGDWLRHRLRDWRRDEDRHTDR